MNNNDLLSLIDREDIDVIYDVTETRPSHSARHPFAYAHNTTVDCV